jgi:uncharacterized protein (TIGR03067 family)
VNPAVSSKTGPVCLQLCYLNIESVLAATDVLLRNPTDFEDDRMKLFVVGALGWSLLVVAGFSTAQDKKTETPKLEGNYKLVGGKVNGSPIGEEAKKGEYSIIAEKFTIKGMGITFVIGYTLDPKTTPVSIDLVILEGPEGTKGSKAQGIIELKGDTLKLAYTMEKDARPKNFEGKEGNVFELKKSK